MTTENVVNNEPFIDSCKEVPQSNLFKIALWLAAILFVPQLLLSLGFGIYYGIVQGENFAFDTFDGWFMSIPVLLTLMLLSPLPTIPLLIKATEGKKGAKYMDFWSVKHVNNEVLVKWLLAGLVFWLVLSLLDQLISLPIEPFMLEIKAANDSLTMTILIIMTICLVAPVIEELVFRGWLYSKLAQTKLGNIGALMLSAMLFTAVHTQYEHSVTLVMIFFLGLFLGYVRYKSNNISYSIAIHILFNSLSTLMLFFFL